LTKIIISAISDLVTDQRLEKVSETLHEEGYEVLLTGSCFKGYTPIKRSYEVKRIKLIFRKGPLFYLEFNLKLFLFLLSNRADLYLANDLDTLFPNFIVSKLRNKKLVYDTHEYFTELPELINRPKVKAIWSKLEKYLLPKIKYSYTVCESISEIYREKYQINMGVIRNLPKSKPVETPLVKIPYPRGTYAIYQGVLNKGRGLELLIDSLMVNKRLNLVIAGDGYHRKYLIERVTKNNLENRVHFTGRLLPGQLRQITQGALLGFSLEENMGLNYYYALPNKLFDYIQANIPVIVSDLPEMRSIVQDYQIGSVLKNRNPETLSVLIEQYIQQPLNPAIQKGLRRASSELIWENEKQKLLGIIKDALK
jgi:glycosyltransferase involved in cell wall biosynthesis